MRFISQWLADTFSTRSQVRFKIRSSGSQFAVFAMPGYTLLDSLRTGKHWVKKANDLEPTICQYKTALEEVRRNPDAASCDTLNRVMPDVVTYVRTLGERASVRTERHFVVYL
jgi:hypothetical protein